MRRMDPAFNGPYTKGAISEDVETERRSAAILKMFMARRGWGPQLGGKHSAPNLTP